MICDSISFETGNNDKHIDYNILLETPYYYSQYPSPTPSTPLSSPSSFLILDDMTVHQHQPSLSSTSTVSVNSIAPAAPQHQSLDNALDGNDDWLLDPFYDVGSFSYQPLAISSAESSQLMNAAAQSLNCPQFQQSIMMAESDEMPIGGLVSPPLSSRTTGENLGTTGNFTIINQQLHFSDYHQHQHQHQHYHHQQQLNKDSTEIENASPLFIASSSSASPQAKQAKKSYSTVPFPNKGRDLNIEYAASTNSSSISSLHPVTNYALSSNNESTAIVVPTTSSSSSSTSTSVARPAPRKKKSRQSPSTFQCDFPGCEKSFTRPYNLNSHRRTHTNEKPFDCPHCPKTFARQHDRNRHAKLHSGVKPFLCLFCCKSFARQDALSRHQLWSEDHKVIGCSILNRKNGKESSTTTQNDATGL